MADFDALRRIKVATDRNPDAEIPFAVFFAILLGVIPAGLTGPASPPGSTGEAVTAPDANYLIPTNAGLVEIQSVSSTRNFTLPALADFPLARDLVIADFSGALSSAAAVLIAPPAGSNTKIVGTYDDQYMLASPGAYLRLRRGKNVNAWVVC